MSDHSPATEVKQLSRGGARKNLSSTEFPGFQCQPDGQVKASLCNLTSKQSSGNLRDKLPFSGSKSGQSMEDTISQVSQLVGSQNERSNTHCPGMNPKCLNAPQMESVQISNPKSSLSSGQRPDIQRSETTSPKPPHILENATLSTEQTQVHSLLPDSPNPQSSQGTSHLNPESVDPMIKRIATSNGFYIKASIKGVDMTFTIDTGATKTVISERVYNAIPKSQRPTLKPTNGLTDATGQPLPQLGTAVFRIRLAPELNFESDIIVANIEDDGLLGHDLLTFGRAICYMMKMFFNLWV